MDRYRQAPEWLIYAGCAVAILLAAGLEALVMLWLFAVALPWFVHRGGLP